MTFQRRYRLWARAAWNAQAISHDRHATDRRHVPRTARVARLFAGTSPYSRSLPHPFTGTRIMDAPKLTPQDTRALTAYLQNSVGLRRDAEACGISPAYCDLIERAADELLRRPDRLADLSRCSAALFGADAWRSTDWKDTPRDDTLGERFFMIFPLLQQLPVLRSWYAEHAIPAHVLTDTLADFQIWIETIAQRTGRPGFHEAGWMREHLYGRVIRLGRLQFQPATYGAAFRPLVHRRSGEIRLVACGGRSITSSGVFSDSEGAQGPFIDLVWNEVDGSVREAHIVQPNGHIATTPTRFDPHDWEQALAPGDAILALHIPAGAPLDFNACRDSFQQAAAFYPSHFPNAPVPRAVTCGSWLFYPGLCDILPVESNIVRFQRAFLRFPSPGATANQTYERAFMPHGRAIKPDQLASSLQHRLYAHIQEGHTPIVGGGMILAPLANWGENPAIRRTATPD